MKLRELENVVRAGEYGTLDKKALDVAIYAHDGALRDAVDSEGRQLPYLTHPLQVFEVIKEVLSVEDEAVLAAALTHDCLEDAREAVTALAIETVGYNPPNKLTRFDNPLVGLLGPVVGGTVFDVSRLGPKKADATERREDYHRANFQLLAAGDRRSALVKIADNVVNYRGRADRGPEKALKAEGKYRPLLEYVAKGHVYWHEAWCPSTLHEDVKALAADALLSDGHEGWRQSA